MVIFLTPLANKKSQRTLACELMNSGLEFFLSQKRRNKISQACRHFDKFSALPVAENKTSQVSRHLGKILALSLSSTNLTWLGEKKSLTSQAFVQPSQKKIWQIKKQSPIARGERALLFFHNPQADDLSN